jgi:hypothetical protein
MHIVHTENINALLLQLATALKPQKCSRPVCITFLLEKKKLFPSSATVNSQVFLHISSSAQKLREKANKIEPGPS